ncbi:tRNA-uridine aminocarboxypropyltransferase 1-like isoform X2 [Ornithodoros turicata]|uniref:tRNA-uridine aminocarboxypropyltransferase 1-like isoform X2 n=1 Tax=Ornithodoros turicata TaxID=34597 RepID=UPI003139A534
MRVMSSANHCMRTSFVPPDVFYVCLPLHIDIIKHAGEVDGKSTAAHLAILAPQDVSVYTYPNIPDYRGKNVLLLFPGENAQSLEQHWQQAQAVVTARRGLCHMCKGLHQGLPWHNLILIDSTWRQTKRIYLDERMEGLPCAVLEGGQSAFWRPQRGKPSSWLATVEAAHLALSRLLELQGCEAHVDDLLFFFKYFYKKIRTKYKDFGLLE